MEELGKYPTITLFLFTTTSNNGAEAEYPYCVWQSEPESY